MKTKSLSLKVSPDIGSVSAELIMGQKSKCIMTLAHGAGAGMDHSFMVTLAQSLAEKGIATLRFNFPFAENKKGRPDTPAVAHQTIETAILKAQKLFPEIPLFVAGKSFGGRMTSQYVAANPNDAVKGIIFYGFPLHPPGKPSVERAEHLKDVASPMLFLQGSKDEFATPELITKVTSSLPQAELIKIEGADHGFKAGKKDIMSQLTMLTHEWIEKIGVLFFSLIILCTSANAQNAADKYKDALALMHEGKYTVPIGIAIQDGNYIGKTGADADYKEDADKGKTSRKNIVPLLHGFAKDFLRVRYMFWVDQQPYFTEDVMPCFSK